MILLSHTTYECPIYCNTNSKITIYRDSHTNRPLILKLTNYDGESISYDSIGNPTSYRGATLTWQKGRQLASINTGTVVLNFKYNIDGLRTEKKVGSKTYSYIWSSGLLMWQSDGTNTLKFSYSPDGRPLGVLFNGTNYYYIYNLQGDVIGLYNNTGTVVVEYTYDSWGKLISTTGSLASTLGKLNPFRYRGYIYDEETGLYWLRSRYYDPEIGRFLNADGLIDNRGVNTQNLFTYCANNPIMYVDITGALHVEHAGLGGVTMNNESVLQKTMQPYQYNSTFSVGLCGSYSTGNIMAGESIVYSFDDSNNCAFQQTTTIGKSLTDGASGGICFSYTNANNLFDLEGYSSGSGVELVAPFGIDIEIIEFYPQENATCFGINVIIPIGASANIYEFEANTKTLKSWRAPLETLVEDIFSLFY